MYIIIYKRTQWSVNAESEAHVPRNRAIFDDLK